MRISYIVDRWFMALYRWFRPKPPDYLPSSSPRSVFPFSRQKLNEVHPDLYELQHEAAGVVFARLGVEYAPDKFDQLLHRYDFGFALFDFTRQLGARLDVLLDIHDSAHEDNKNIFLYGVNFVCRVEQEAKTTTLDPNPLFKALSEQLGITEALFKLYRQVSALHQLVEKTDIVFPIYRSFREELLESMKDWHQMSFSDVEEVGKLLQGFTDIQRMFEEVTKDIDAKSSWIKGHVNKLGKLSYVASQIADEIKIIKVDILSGKCRPDEGISKLYELLDKLKVIANYIGYADEDLRVKYSSLLGVPVSATKKMIKSAYRKLAKKVHSDRNRDDPMADEKFKKTNEAYKWLEAHSPD